jgi:hypothetical protein
VGGSVVSRPSPPWPLLPVGDRERLDAFLARLARMSPEQRIRDSRYKFKAWERQVWAGHYPDEVPLINGEVEWIALKLADLD